MPIKLNNARRISYENNTVFSDFIDVSWVSDNTNVAVVSSDGVVTTVSVGEADISLVVGRKSYTYHLVVQP